MPRVLYSDAEMAEMWREEYALNPTKVAERVAERTGAKANSVTARMSKLRKQGVDIPAGRNRTRGVWCPECGAAPSAWHKDRVIDD